MKITLEAIKAGTSPAVASRIFSTCSVSVNDSMVAVEMMKSKEAEQKPAK